MKTATLFPLFDHSLIEGAVDLGVLEVDIAKPLCNKWIRLHCFRKQNLRVEEIKILYVRNANLCMERSPADEESNNNGCEK